MVESEVGSATDLTPGVGGHGAMLAFSWLSWRLDEIKSWRGGPIAIFAGKSATLLGFLVKIQKKSDSTHSTSEGAVNAYFFNGLVLQVDVLVWGRCFLGQSQDGAEPGCEVSRRVKPALHIFKE